MSNVCCTTVSQFTMELQAVLLLALLGSAVPSINGECVEGDSKYQEGEVWTKEGECASYTCLEDGTHNITECTSQEIPPGWTEGKPDPSKPFPDCCGAPIPPLDIVPDILETLKWADLLDVTYGGDLSIEPGNELGPIEVQHPPEVNFTGDPADWHLLLMTDPDAPSRKYPKLKEVQHWLVGNIPGFNVSAGEVISEYLAPAPAEGTGLHRYVFMVYKQFGKLSFDKDLLTDAEELKRVKFSTKKFVEKYNLSEPVALNVFQAQWDNRAVSLRRLDGKGSELSVKPLEGKGNGIA